MARLTTGLDVRFDDIVADKKNNLDKTLIKKELQRIYCENEVKHELKLSEKYNPNNLFKSKEQIIPIIKEQPEVSLIDPKKYPMHIRFINKVRGFFSKFIKRN